MADPILSLRGVRKAFGDGLVALEGIDLDVQRGELVCLLGPSGCGKSTLLNIVAGFTEPSAGSVTLSGRAIEGPGADRAMVFQEYALFPWLTVAENVAFGLEVRGDPKERVRARVDELLGRLFIGDFRDRYPKDLSGGMRQRVAIARALAIDSAMLLMDEPFGALDALTRRSLQEELLNIWRDFARTVLFVTHGIDESLLLADRVVVMTYRPGTVKRIIEVGLPRPRDPASPQFVQLARELTALVMEEERRRERDELRATPPR